MEMAREIPGAHGVELLDAGHLVMEERPAEFVRLVTDFLAGASTGEATTSGVEA